MGSSVGQAILTLIMLIITFSMVDMFDTIGTLIGTAKSANMLDEDGNIPNVRRAFSVMQSQRLAVLYLVLPPLPLMVNVSPESA